MSEHKHKPIACPECGEELDTSIQLTKEQGGGPGPGDATVCARCLSLLVFEPGPSLRKMTDAEKVALERDFPDEFAVISRARDSVRKQRGYI